MNDKNKKSNLSSLAPLLLFVVFTTCVLMVLLTGADVYQKFTKRNQTSFDQRTTIQYLTTRFRQSDTADAYFISDFDSDSPQSEGDTFFFCETYKERTFFTRIYHHDGYLYELFSEKGIPLEPTAGEKIVAVNDIRFSSEGSLLTIYIEHPNGETDTISLHMRSGKGGTYAK